MTEENDFPDELELCRSTPTSWKKIWIRSKALEAASRTTVDMDPEVTLQTAGKFEEWLIRDGD